jgi:hypothetical protein
MEEGDPFTKARPTKWGSNEPIQGQVVLSCKDRMRQLAVDDPLLSCKQQAGVNPPPAPEGVTR